MINENIKVKGSLETSLATLSNKIVGLSTQGYSINTKKENELAFTVILLHIRNDGFIVYNNINIIDNLI